MNILTSIEGIVKGHFGELFENIESFYLKNFLILIQGLLTQTNTSVSGMTLNSLNSLSHTTLTRFLRGYNPFWESLQKEFWHVIGSKVPVSYTHLTLPTILLVQISVVAVSLKKKTKKTNSIDEHVRPTNDSNCTS
eukprot:TRINITY_DN23670_c0_g1_i2.p1 TRINITY_DN23670_c0_g1~~TRINITY_DN23670_c0_g1_i2.p1  ORF type:complete len:136 (-),score=18.62 TRINITY_DN23670_c0_g1_i2:39-446(-)